MSALILSVVLVACSGWTEAQPATLTAVEEFNARDFFQKVRKQAAMIEPADSQPRTEEEKKAVDMLQIAAAHSDHLFENLSDSESATLCEAISHLYSRFYDGTDSGLILAVWDSFIRHYPRSPHIDKARWVRAKTAAAPYEYEGHADAALQQIEEIEQFIKKFPANHYLSDAKLELAQAYRIAYETFRYGQGLSTDSDMNPQMAGQKYRDRAKHLLRGLCDKSPDPVRSNACRALKDLAQGRCVYMGPGSWNPNVPDNWAAPKTRQ